MDISKLIEQLNEKQREAVTTSAKHVFVSAGPGSGKTRVIVHRIAWLVEVEGILPQTILGVTFTNKAAQSMRSRIEEMLHQNAHGMWIGTFHSICHRILRQHYEAAQLPQYFQILDSDDQLRIIKRIVKEMNLDDEYWQPRKIQDFINSKKDQGVRAEHVRPYDVYSETMQQIYFAYEAQCQRIGVIDFAELILRVCDLWKNHPEILHFYQQRFRVILVDEFQDTNTIQYTWLRLIGDPNNSRVMIVGDDDQSIYSWRGACVDNIQHFLKDFTGAITIHLEQNYRSTQTIVNASRALIENNRSRLLGKALRSENHEGDLITVYAAFSEVDEARFILGQIQRFIEQGDSYQEIAILYRSNAQSRILEEALLQANIPYIIYGGFRFFERAEIKDALAYLRLVVSNEDDAAFERIVNVPARALGDKSIQHLRDIAREKNISLWQASVITLAEEQFPTRAHNQLKSFLELIEHMRTRIADLAFADQVEYVIQASGLIDHYSKEKGEKAQAKVENLAELVSAAREYTPAEEDCESLLTDFLAQVTLDSNNEEKQNDVNRSLKLMTLHAAKGLEFPLVFISGVEEGLLPHPMSAEEAHELEEERRLFYVGMTRAEKQLCITFAETRRVHGREQFHRRSRFIDEIPDQYLQHIRLRTTITRPGLYASEKKSTKPITRDSEYKMKIGQHVCHQQFGEGIVMSYEGDGEHTRIQVRFSSGTKWLLESYANLEAVE